MTTEELALKKLREICLSFPNTSEGTHFRKVAFLVGGKMFATFGNEKGAYRIAIGLRAESARALLESDPRFQPYARDGRAVTIDIADVTDWSELRKLLEQSYALASEPAPKAKTSGRKRSPGRK